MASVEDIKVADAVSGSWVYRTLPKSLWPYAQLARWERPIGWQLLLWPCLWSLVLVHLNSAYLHSAGQSILPQFNNLLYYLFLLSVMMIPAVLFIIGAIAMRGAGCTYNDIVDRDIDEKVERTKSRPIPSGRVTTKAALIFLALQLLVGSAVLLTLSNGRVNVFLLGIASIILVLIYPFMKRITWWPQLFLGLAFSWGALMGWAAINGELSLSPILLYSGCIFWVIGYDTIYAHQDTEDDAIVGVKSTARLFAEKSAMAITVLYAFALVLFAASWWAAIPSFDWNFIPAYLGLAIGAFHLGWQIRSLNIDDNDQCLVLFKSNNRFGAIVFTGLFISLLVNLEIFAAN